MNPPPPKGPKAPAMKLLDFVTQLLQTGSVVLSPVLVPFEQQDKAATAALLEKYHRWDAMSMPMAAPGFHAAAAIWAAAYVCRALQFLMVRNLDEDQIKAYLQPFPMPITDEAIYSADICLRHLPDIYSFARALSPSDPLVLNMQSTAMAWPFSAVGIDVEGILATSHPSLQLAYADRVLAAHDRKRAAEPSLNLRLQAALGAHGKRFWADFEPFELENNDNARTIEH